MREIKFKFVDEQRTVITASLEGIFEDIDAYYSRMECIGQYTGVKDVDNIEIYEGDIVESDKTAFEVYWNDDVTLVLGWCLWGLDGEGCMHLDGLGDYKVVGNIHD